MTQQSISKTWVHGLMLLTIILVAASFPVGAYIAPALPSEVLMFIRFLLAACLFAPYVFIKHGLHFPPMKTLLGYGVLSVPLVVFFWCMFEALRYTSAVNTGALYTTVPAITAIYGFFLNKELTSKVRSLGLMVGTLGALWIIFRGDLQAFTSLSLNYGDGLFFVGCLFMGFYNPLVKKLYKGEPMEVMTFWVIFIASIWLFALSAGSLQDVEWQMVSPKVYVGIGYLAIFTTLVSFFVMQLAAVKIGPTKVAAYSFLTPVIVIVMGFVLGAEVFNWSMVPGVMLVLLAMVIIQKERNSSAKLSQV